MKSEMLHERKEFLNHRDLIEWAAETYAGKTAYSFRTSLSAPKTKISFTQFRDDVRALTSRLAKMNVAGKKCVMIGGFSYSFALVYFSVIIAGGILVPLDRDWQAAELAKTARKADASFLFIDEELKEKAEAISSECSLECEPVYISGYGSGEGLEAFIEEGRAIYERTPEIYASLDNGSLHTSLIVFTSGTTGEGKGVMLNQRGILDDVSSVVPYVDFSDKTVGVLPLHHTYGSTVMLVGHIAIGSEVYISQGLRYVQKELREEKPGHLILVPLYLETFYRKIMANVKEQGKEKLLSRMIKISNFLLKLGIDLRKKLFSSVRAAFGGEVKMIISGGAPINAEIIDFFSAVGISTLNGYGITECSPIIAVNRTKRVVKGSVGSVLDINEVKIDSPNEAGEGEILVRGSNVMQGYYKNDEATKAAFDSEGFFRTGDYGRLDGDILTITGRKKNLIILSNGKNVYTEEIENELTATPGVLDIIVYEGQSRRGLEHNAIVAEIYPDKDYIEKNSIRDIRAHISRYIEEYNKTAVPYKKIAVLKIRDEEFPKNTLRKIMRFKLDLTID